MRPSTLVIATGIGFVTAVGLSGQLWRSAFVDRDHPAIQYSTRATSDAVARLNQQLAGGKAQFGFDAIQGYLPSVLKSLNVLPESQVAVFSKTSLQSHLISPQNPRAIFFNDNVALAWTPGGFIELAAHDPQQGVVFYILEQRQTANPAFVRTDMCLSCHDSLSASGVPGFLLRSSPTRPDGRTMRWLGEFTIDHRSPIAERWGGWYVTGKTDGITHLGNRMTTDPNAVEVSGRSELMSLRDSVDVTRYPSAHSDVVALMVLEHQAQMLNLFTRVGWETRLAATITDKGMALMANKTVTDGVNELVDYLMFVDETPFAGVIQSTVRLCREVHGQGPKTSDGRSLRDFHLRGRLMRYPCSYMIYSEGFEGLPSAAKGAIYRRMWQVLSGQQGGKYARLTLADRRSVVEILRETKNGLPAYFSALN